MPLSLVSLQATCTRGGPLCNPPRATRTARGRREAETKGAGGGPRRVKPEPLALHPYRGWMIRLCLRATLAAIPRRSGSPARYRLGEGQNARRRWIADCAGLDATPTAIRFANPAPVEPVDAPAPVVEVEGYEFAVTGSQFDGFSHRRITSLRGAEEVTTEVRLQLAGIYVPHWDRYHKTRACQL